MLIPSFSHQIAYKKYAKFFATYGFPTLYTKLPQDKLKFKFRPLLNPVLKEGTKFFLDYSITVYHTGEETKRGLGY